MNIGFALIPNGYFIEKLVELQAEINQKYHLEPSLSIEKNLPHVTILQGNFHDHFDYEKTAQRLTQQLEKNQSDIGLSFTHILYKELGWFFLLCRKEPWLLDLHKQACSIARGDMVVTEEIKQADDLEFLPPLERYNHLTYGYRYMDDAYLPHITLGRNITNPIATHQYGQTIWKDLSIPPFQRMKRLTVYTMGVNGAHADTLWEKNV